MSTSYALGLHFGHVGGFRSGGGRIGSFFVHAAIWGVIRRLFIEYPGILWPVVVVLVAAAVIWFIRRRRRFA